MKARTLAIEMNDVTFYPHDEAGIKGVTLTVRQGTLLGIVGPAGSGKSTLVKLLTGVYRPRHGSVLVLNSDPLRFNARTRQQVALMLKPEALNHELTVLGQLQFIASLYGFESDTMHRRIQQVLDQLRLTRLRDAPIGKLSPYPLQRVALACTLIQSPKVIVADTPADDLEPAQRARLWNDLLAVHAQLRSRPHTMVVTTRYADLARHCELVSVLGHGELLCTDTPRGLQRRALGGDLLRLWAAPDWCGLVQEVVTTAPGILSVTHPEQIYDSVIVLVDNIQRRLPQLETLLRSAIGAQLFKIEPYWMPLEKVVAHLVETGVGGCEPKHAQTA
jgi:ABC-2 type transport system ATP-binding protein